jgi:hypothetical protein
MNGTMLQNRIVLLPGIFLLLICGVAEADSGFIGRCLLEIDGKKFLNGSCPIYMGPNG